MQKVPESEMAVAMSWVLKEKATWNAHLRETYQKDHVLKTAYEALELKEKDATAKWKSERKTRELSGEEIQKKCALEPEARKEHAKLVSSLEKYSFQVADMEAELATLRALLKSKQDQLDVALADVETKGNLR